MQQTTTINGQHNQEMEEAGCQCYLLLDEKQNKVVVYGPICRDSQKQFMKQPCKPSRKGKFTV